MTMARAKRAAVNGSTAAEGRAVAQVQVPVVGTADARVRSSAPFQRGACRPAHLLYLSPLAIITCSFYRDAAQHACDGRPAIAPSGRA